MSFWNRLFGSAEKTSEEERKERQERDFNALKYDGVAAMRQNALEYAIRCFVYALELRDDGETRDYLAHTLIRYGNLPEAYRQLEYLAEMEPSNVAILLRMADVAYMMEDYDAMGEACEKANEVDSENVMVNYSYARACVGKADYVNAIALLSKAINLSKEEPFWDAHLLKGQTLLRMGYVEMAEPEADAILGALPEQEDALLLKARCVEVKGDNDAALELYGKIIELNPFCLDAFRERAEIRNVTGNTQGAEEDWRMVGEILDNEPSATEAGRQKKDIRQETEEAYKSLNPFA